MRPPWPFPSPLGLGRHARRHAKARRILDPGHENPKDVDLTRIFMGFLSDFMGFTMAIPKQNGDFMGFIMINR